MRASLSTSGLAVLACAALSAGAAFAAGCSLDGLVFDVPPGDTASSVGSGGASSSSGGSSSDGGGGSSASSTGGGASETACSDGVDNDGDGSVDCDDSDCGDAGYTCINAAPAGWSGPVLLFEGDEASKPTCSGQYPMTVFDGVSGLTSSGVMCNACSCSKPDVECTLPEIDVHSDLDCMTSVAGDFQAIDEGKCGTANVSQAQSIQIPKAGINVTGCEPSGGGVAFAPSPWKNTALVCGESQQSSCSGAGKTCAPPTTGSFLNRRCIARSGSADCPGAYTDRHELGKSTAVTDNRGCSKCGCPDPSKFSCSVEYTFYTLEQCSGPSRKVTSDNICHNTMSPVDVKSYEFTLTYPTSCAPSGGEPEGNVISTAPFTVCCLPP